MNRNDSIQFRSIILVDIQQNTIPNIWKLNKVVSILKPTKSPTEPSSYRQISLHCNPLKILERLILNAIILEIPLSPTYHGFRVKHSTTALFTTLTQHIHEGLNALKPELSTLLTTIDRSKAFDTVPRTLRIQKINREKHQNTIPEVSVELLYRETCLYCQQQHTIHKETLPQWSSARVDTFNDSFQPFHARHTYLSTSGHTHYLLRR